jgi:DNA polymerase III alpha subunit
VGRGSSIASYVLYLLGVHRIDSYKFNLDIKEFLK